MGTAVAAAPNRARRERKGTPQGSPISPLFSNMDATTAGTAGEPTIGARPSPTSVQSVCRRVSGLTTRRDGLLPPGDVVPRLNRLLTGWANYFILGWVTLRLTGTPRGGCVSGSCRKESDRYKVANCAHAQPVFYVFARLAHGKVISVSVLTRIMREGVDSGRDTRASVWYKRSIYKRLATTEAPA